MALLRFAWRWVALHLLGHTLAPSDPTDARYPRPLWIRTLRWLALRPWWVLAAVYVPAISSALLPAILQSSLGKKVSWSQLLLIDQILALLKIHLWIIAPISAVCIFAGVIGGHAYFDRQREKSVLALREKLKDQEQAQQLQAKGQKELLQQMSNHFPLLNTTTGTTGVQGPPFDEALLPAPDHFVGRAADLEWVLSRLRSGNATAITALGGLGGHRQDRIGSPGGMATARGRAV